MLRTRQGSGRGVYTRVVFRVWEGVYFSILWIVHAALSSRPVRACGCDAKGARNVLAAAGRAPTAFRTTLHSC